MPLPQKQQDKLQTIADKLAGLVSEVTDRKVLEQLEEAQRRLSAAAREASGDWS